MAASPPQSRRRAPRPSIDLGEILNSPDQLSKIEFTRPETPQEQQVRLRAEGFSAWVGVIKNLIIVTFVAIGVGVILWYCLGLMNNIAASPDEKKWAQTILGGAVTAGLGYLIGKSN